MSKLSCDIKYMYRASTGCKFILVVADEVMTFVVLIPPYKVASHENCRRCHKSGVL